MSKKFKLQPVLNHRGNLETEARQRLAQSLEREKSLIWQITESRARLRELCGDLEERQRKGIRFADLLLHKARIEGVEALLVNLKRDLEHVHQQIVICRRDLCDASRDKKLLERLKEKVGEEQRQCRNRQETIMLDEISLRFGKGDL